MEEDIKILENLLEEGFEAMCYLEAHAIENLIKAYKEDEAVIEEQNRMIDLIVDKFKEGTEYYYSEFDYMSKEDIKEYFRNKVKEKKHIE